MGERTSERLQFFGETPCRDEARPLFIGNGQIRIGLVILQVDIEHRLPVFYEQVFKDECFRFGIRHDYFDASCVFHERCYHRTAVGSQNVLRNPCSEILCFSDVNHFAESVFELVYSRSLGQFFEQKFVNDVGISGVPRVFQNRPPHKTGIYIRKTDALQLGFFFLSSKIDLKK